MEAEAKAGELLIEMKAEGERTDGYAPMKVEPQTAAPPTLDDLGVTRDESSRWQAVARIPAEERAAYVAEAQQDELEVTRAGLLRRANQKKTEEWDRTVAKQSAIHERADPSGRFRLPHAATAHNCHLR